MQQVKDRLIVALDVDTMEKMTALVEQLGDTVSYYKVGMELYYSAGAQAVTYLRSKNKRIFVDLKLHDIPNTVARSAAVLTRLGATMINVHAGGGKTMMQKAAAATAAAAADMGIARPKIIAVTILTSMAEDEWQQLGGHGTIGDQVVRLAKLAQEAGLDGVVASPQEAEAIRQACGRDFLIVTPGIRPQAAAVNDQHRIATPSAALQAGASHLVVGRPITASAQPRQAALEILNEILRY